MQTEFKIKLFPHFDPDADADQRKKVGQKIVALMLKNLRKRGRPKKDEEELKDVA